MKAQAGHKKCNVCQQVQTLDRFSKDKTRSDGLQPRCKSCYSEYHAALKAARVTPKEPRQAVFRGREKEYMRQYRKDYLASKRGAIYAKNNARYAAKMRAIPRWADLDAIRAVYDAAVWLSTITGEAWHVDHIVPLRSKIVCGLHCEANLQLLPMRENIAKGNRFWPGMPR